MRPLTKRERRLAIMFGVTIFVAANIIGLTVLLRKQGEMHANLDNLRIRQFQADGWLAEKGTWRQRKEWLDKTQPVLKSAGEANAALLESLTSSAAKHSLVIVKQGFAEPDPEHKHPYQEIAVNLTVSGPLEAVTRWLVEIQQPASFQAVPKLSMKVDNDPAKMVCVVTVARYYAPAR